MGSTDGEDQTPGDPTSKNLKGEGIPLDPRMTIIVCLFEIIFFFKNRNQFVVIIPAQQSWRGC
jgi:hypothetical protein